MEKIKYNQIGVTEEAYIAITEYKHRLAVQMKSNISYSEAILTLIGVTAIKNNA
jgi:hypothetical protein